MQIWSYFGQPQSTSYISTRKTSEICIATVNIDQQFIAGEQLRCETSFFAHLQCPPLPFGWKAFISFRKL